MLPKPEKKKKISSQTEQLDLVDSISSADKARKKRNLLIVSLLFTIGLPLVFSVYNHFRNFNLKNINISLPSLSKSTNTPVQSALPLDQSLEALLPSDSSFSLYLRFQSPSYPDYSYSYQAQYLFQDQNYMQILNSLQTQPPDTDSILASLLPSGVNLQQNIIQTGSNLELQSLIQVPQRQILIISRLDPSTSSLTLDSLSSLHQKIYWLLLSQN